MLWKKMAAKETVLRNTDAQAGAMQVLACNNILKWILNFAASQEGRKRKWVLFSTDQKHELSKTSAAK